MSLSAPQSPRRPSTPASELWQSGSPSYLRIPYLISERAKSLTPTRSIMSTNIRRRIPRYSTIDDAAALIKESENIVVLVGAGISISVGIPDFRSSQGLYNQVRGKRNFQDPQQLFETDTFLTQPREFWEDVQPIIPKLKTATTTSSAVVNTVPQFSSIHAFLNLLQSKAKLLTVFTQNIDGLEFAAGVDESKTIKCHGSWDTSTCITCNGQIGADDYLPVVHAGKLPLCSCAKPVLESNGDSGVGARRGGRARKEKAADADVEYLDTQPQAVTLRTKTSLKKATKKRKRRNSDDNDDESETSDPLGRPGLLKPDITFFGDSISDDYSPERIRIKPKVDLLLIIGTSLPVEPVNLLPLEIPANVPQVWLSMERCKREGLAVDIQIIGDCNLVVEELCRRAGWTNGLVNRLWRNHRGSNLQAKEALRAQKAATVVTGNVAATGASNKLSLRQSQTEKKAAEVKKAVEVKNEKQEKQAVETKVKVEQMIGFDNVWMVKKMET